MKKFGLCGNPVVHSLSPKLFAVAYPQDRYSYELFQTSDPREAIHLFLKKGLVGMNVTSPLKISILPFVHRQMPECAIIGACNLVLKQDDFLVACNTDYLGVSNSLIQAHVSMKNTICLLLGAGGAAKAAAYALLQEGALLLWANRTLAHIPHSFNSFSIRSIPLHQAAHYLPICNIIVNTLPLPFADTNIFKFHAQQIVFDASYATRPLEKQAIHAGSQYISGEQWLLYQAIPSFTAMTGIPPPTHLLEEAIKRYLPLSK